MLLKMYKFPKEEDCPSPHRGWDLPAPKNGFKIENNPLILIE